MRTAFIIVLLARALLCYAQSAPDSQPMGQAVAKSSFDEISIVGYVPEFLRLNFDFSQDNKVRLAGFYPTLSAVKEKIPHIPLLEFKISPRASIELGRAVIVSNIEGTYTISAFSENGGWLRASSGNQEAKIGYSLSLDGQTARAENGVFKFYRSGKSRNGGIHLGVGIILDEIMPPLAHEMYTDELSFAITTH